MLCFIPHPPFVVLIVAHGCELPLVALTNACAVRGVVLLVGGCCA
jgi:hypothetical protein